MALDGSAVSSALAAFMRTADAGRAVVGIGLNRWGETTFALPTGATAFGKPHERFVTFDHRGSSAPKTNIERRSYVLVRRSSTRSGSGGCAPPRCAGRWLASRSVGAIASRPPSWPQARGPGRSSS